MDLNIFGGLFFSITKIGLLFFLILYFVFAFIVNKQVSLMTKTLEVGFESVLKAIALLHILASVAIFIYAFFAL